MNVLALYKKENGADYHRIVVPFSNMDGVDWKLKDYSEGLTDEDFDVDVVVFNRVFPFGLDHLVRLKIRYGFSVVVDLDDYWELPVNHYLYHLWKQNETSEKIREMIQIADFVWVTNELLYKEVRELFHDRVEVVKNAVVEKESVKLERESVNVGYASGASHLNDLKRIEGLFPRLAGDKWWKDKGVFVLGGWENSKTGIFETKKKIIQKCNKYICIDRIGIDNYMHFYDLLDVSIAPLEYSKFNSCKCLVGSTLIPTNNGIKTISEIVSLKSHDNIEINGNLYPIINHFKYENQSTIKIITEKGFELEGSRHHRIKINDSWIELSSLKIGDDIKITPFKILSNSYQELSYPMLLSKKITKDTLDNACDSMIPKIKINERWGRFFGYMLGDGHFSNNGISISCDKRHTEVVNDVISLYQEIGLYPQLIYKKPDKRCKTVLIKEGNALDIKASSRNLLELCKKYNLVSESGKTFEIPKFILNSPKSVIREFLKGLFEADGTVAESSVSFCTKSEVLAKQIQILLLGFDIVTRLSKRYNKQYRKYYYYLDTRRISLNTFYNEIGFISIHKKEKLRLAYEKKISNACITDIYEDKIIKIEENINTVYDIEVDTMHCYNSAGIISHNSNLKFLESATKRLPFVCSYVPPYTVDEKLNGEGIAFSAKVADWYRNIMRLVRSVNMREDWGERNYEYCKENYNLEKENVKRIQILKSL